MEVISAMTSRPPLPLGRARKGLAKLSSKSTVAREEALRHWSGLPVEARQKLLHFRDRGVVERAYATQEGLRKFEQDCMQKGIVFRNTEGLTVVSLGLSSFGFLPQASSPSEPVAPEAFFARDGLLGQADKQFAEYLEGRLGGFLTGCRPPLRRELWPSIFEPAPHSWMEFECQALRLVEQAILQSYLEEASAAAALEAAVASKADEVPEDTWLALAEELSEPAPAPGKKARRKAARRRVRLAAAASGGECEDKGEAEPELEEEAVAEETVAEDVPSGKEAWPSGEAAEEDARSQAGEHEVISPSSRKKDRKQVSDVLSFGGHSRVGSQNSAWGDTACGSSSGVKSNYSECGSETVESGSDVGDVAVLSVGMECCPDGEAASTVTPEPLPLVMCGEWISNGRYGDAAEWYLCLTSELSERGSSSCCKAEDKGLLGPLHSSASAVGVRAVVKRTFLDLEVAEKSTGPVRLRSRSVGFAF